jgi:cation/acetate symporter
MLLLGGALLAGLALAKFNFNPLNLFAEGARIYGEQVLTPGPLTKNPWDVVSLSLALFLGTAALPHILMRFYTVPDAKQARTSVLYASMVVGVFYIFTFIIGFSAMVLLGKEAIMAVDKTGNVSALLLANLLGGVGFLGFIAAVAFATILAVVAGLTLSGAATLSHDFWVSIVKKGKASNKEQMNVARIATLLLGATSIFLGIVFKKQNVAFMVGLAFAVAASSNFPALILTTFWRRCTTPGVVASMIVGTVSSLLFIYFSPAVQIDILGKTDALFPLKTPGLFSIPLSFLTAIVVSLCTKDQRSHDRFALVTQKIHLGDFVAKHREIAHGEKPHLPEMDATTLLMVAEETAELKPAKGTLSSQEA